MKQLKSTDFKWHLDQPDVPDMSALQMKAFLDAPTQILMDKVNEVIGKDGAPSLKEMDGRTLSLEEKVVQLFVGDKAVEREVAPAVIEAASATVDKALSHNNGSVLRFLLCADVHQKNDHELITKSTLELGQAMAEILKLIDVDLVANLGDMAWGGGDDTAPKVLEQLKTCKRLTSVCGARRLYCEGNHDDGNVALTNHPDGRTLTTGEMDGILGTAAVKDPKHSQEGYGYIDFENQKVRVIFLNTARGFSDHQAKWLGEEALKVEDGWGVITMAHHPLDYGMSYAALQIIRAFIEHGMWMQSGDTGDIFANFTNNKGFYIGHFHGHTHSYSMLRMRDGVNGNFESLQAWQMGIPNACYTRTNEHALYESEALGRYADEVTYHKENVDGKRTSFTLVTVCLDEQKVYLDNYGVGIDRQVDYNFISYTNQLPISTDTDGSIYNGVGYKTGSQLKDTDGTVIEGGQNAVTGFIPLENYGSSQSAVGEVMMYLQNTEILPDSTSRLVFYDADKKFIGALYGSQFVSQAEPVKVVYTLGEDGYIDSLDLSALTGYYYASSTLATAAYFRISSPGIDGDTIITVR